MKSKSYFMGFAMIITACNINTGSVSSSEEVDNFIRLSFVDNSPIYAESVLDKRGKEVELKDVTSYYSLNVRYSGYSCNSCISKILETIKKNDIRCGVLVSKIPIYNLHYIANEYPTAIFYKCDSLNVDFDKGITPYAFITDDSLHVIDYQYYDNDDPDKFLSFISSHG